MIKYTIFALYTMPYCLLIVTRTLANSIEGILITISLYYWLQKDKKYCWFYFKIFIKNKIRNDIIARIIITVNFLCRSTSLLPWPLLFVYFIKNCYYNAKINFFLDI